MTPTVKKIVTETFPLPDKFLADEKIKLSDLNLKQSLVSVGNKSKSRDHAAKRSSLSRDSKLNRRSNKNSVHEKCKH